MLKDKEIKEISTEFLRLKEYEEHGRTITYSALDMFQLQIGTKLKFFYKYCQQEELTVEKMKESLIETLTHYPDLTGTLHYKKNELLLEYNNKGVEFITSNANFNFKDIEDVQFDMTKLGIRLFKEDIVFLTKEDPLLTIKVITLRDRSIILLLSMHHAVSDMYGIVWFLNAWASVTKYGNVGQYMNTINRGIMFGNGNICSLPHNQIIIDHTGSPYTFDLKGSMSSKDLFVKRSILENIKAELFPLRTEKDVAYISCHDVMSAIFWRAVVKAKGMKEDESARFGNSIECRKYLDIKDGYFGNCVILKTLDINVKDLLSMSLVDLACMIRKMVLSVNREYLYSLISFMEKAEDRRKTVPDLNLTHNAFFITSWTKFDPYSVDFSCGRAKHFSYDGIAYSLTVIYPTENGNGYNVRLNFLDSELKMMLCDEEVKMLSQQ